MITAFRLDHTYLINFSVSAAWNVGHGRKSGSSIGQTYCACLRSQNPLIFVKTTKTAVHYLEPSRK